jgi:histidinol-phosphate aminotransferase
MSIVEQAPSYVRAISPYIPGKPITELARQMGIPVEKIVKLASNENPLGMSPKARGGGGVPCPVSSAIRTSSI